MQSRSCKRLEYCKIARFRFSGQSLTLYNTLRFLANKKRGLFVIWLTNKFNVCSQQHDRANSILPLADCKRHVLTVSGDAKSGSSFFSHLNVQFKFIDLKMLVDLFIRREFKTKSLFHLNLGCDIVIVKDFMNISTSS